MDFIENTQEISVSPQDNDKTRWHGESGSTREVPGTIANTIGTGDDARNSIAFIVIVGCFIVGGIITVLVIFNYWLFRDAEKKVPDIVSDLKVVWEIVIPIITLVLGYAFGKNER